MSEKQEDFIGKLKRMKNDAGTPSVIQDTLNQLEEIKKENEKLKNSEDFLKRTVEKLEKLRKENMETLDRLQLELAEVKKQNVEFRNKVYIMEDELKEKESQYVLKDTIESLTQEKETLKKELSEREGEYTIDYVIPVIEPVSSKSEPEPEITKSSSTLEALTQDLQSDLNRYKKIVEKLKTDNKNLKNDLESRSTPRLSKDIDKILNENAALKKEITELQKTHLKNMLTKDSLEPPK